MPRTSAARTPLLFLVFAATVGLVAGDPNDWVGVDYVSKGPKGSDTAAARQHILGLASGYAQKGPWTVTSKKNVKPPSGDVKDYLSWAPYHWPNCNWCATGASHLSGPSKDGNSTDDPDAGWDDGNDPNDDSYEDGGEFDDSDDDYTASSADVLPRDVDDLRIYGRGHTRMVRRRRHLFGRSASSPSPTRLEDQSQAQATVAIQNKVSDVLSDAPLPTTPPDEGSLPTGLPGQTTTWQTLSGTPAPAEAPARTKKGGKSACTPSPTTKMAPSATWTTCPYVVRDGKVNPDVRTLPDSPAAVTMSQAVLYNAIAYAIEKSSRAYSQNVAKFIDTFFLSPSTGVNPNMNFGQQVRGPGKEHQMGTWTGILDMRGLVKVVNAIAVLKAAGSSDWTAAREKAMTNWMRSYVSWLENSALGKQLAKKGNNHYTFYVNQLAAAKLYLGDTEGAQNALKNYFGHQFKDQVAQSGEQPFEAVRTRPYHYRSFNLEAMITNAKLGDELGLDFWSAKSKYGSTIQTALDYAMSQNPGKERVSDIIPHVAAVAAAYGDPSGKYSAFLKKNDPDHATQPFWYYDQTGAVPHSPAARNHKRSLGADALATREDGKNGTVTAEEKGQPPQVPFVCPAVFDDAKETELEDGLFVSCDELKPFYGISHFVDPDTM